MKKHGVFIKGFSGLLPVLLLSLFLVAVLFTGTAQADRSFDLQQVLYEAQLLPDASMEVTERYTIDFSGKWNGFYVSIPQGDTPIRDVVVSEKGQAYEFNPGTDYGPPGTFLVKQEGDNLLIDWSIDAEDETRTFEVSYRVLNAVKIHQDVAEFYRQFVGEENQQEIDTLKAVVKLPPGAEKYSQGEDIRVWGHGPLNGNVEFTGPGEVSWNLSNLSAGTFVEGRVVMPVDLFPQAPGSVYTNKSALESILEEEGGWAEAANRQRLFARFEIAGAAAAVGGALLFIFFLWRKHGRSHPVSFDGEYYRELPADYSPAELSQLLKYRKIEAKDFTATILDLARRKYLRIDEEIVEKDRFLFGTKKEEAYRLTFLPAPEPASLRNPGEAVLRPHEKDLLKYLADTVAGGKGYVYLHEIEDFAKENSEEFYSFWEEWTQQVFFQADELEFFEYNGGLIIKTALMGLGVIILAVLAFSRLPILGVGLFIGGLLVVIVPLTFRRRSQGAQEDYVKWQAFRKFLLDFSQMERHEIPSLVIWEHYLVYAVTLGVAKEVIQQLELVFPNMQEGDYRFGYGWYYFGPHAHFAAFSSSLNSINNSVEQAVKTVQTAASKVSSGSGGGGGFSGGGGGGGGGGSFGGR
ncbi:MAG TPA: DUF2207 domain-containing protein [Clostridia bacterium]|jgi:uncharacterized membrane protein|nr:DUF2207 domain-containing protein [Clostridia bacterium]